MLPVDETVDVDLSRIIRRAFQEAEKDGAGYDAATGAAVRAVLAVYPDWSRDQAVDQILRLGRNRQYQSEL
jgi:hypothetical protein